MWGSQGMVETVLKPILIPTSPSKKRRKTSNTCYHYAVVTSIFVFEIYFLYLDIWLLLFTVYILSYSLMGSYKLHFFTLKLLKNKNRLSFYSCIGNISRRLHLCCLRNVLILFVIGLCIFCSMWTWALFCLVFVHSEISDKKCPKLQILQIRIL